MKRLLLLPILALVIFASGCASVQKTITPALVQSSVTATVGFGVQKYPTALPAVKVGVEVICSMANSTNIAPAVIVAAVERSEWQTLKTPEAVFILQGVISVYTVAWNSYGAEAVSNSVVFRPYLQALCQGGTDGLAGRTRSTVGQWPQLRFP